MLGKGFYEGCDDRGDAFGLIAVTELEHGTNARSILLQGVKLNWPKAMQQQTVLLESTNLRNNVRIRDDYVCYLESYKQAREPSTKVYCNRAQNLAEKLRGLNSAALYSSCVDVRSIPYPPKTKP